MPTDPTVPPEAVSGTQGSEEGTKSYVPKKAAANAPKQVHYPGDQVRHMEGGRTYDCEVKHAKLENGVWTYSLVTRTVDKAPYKNGVYIAGGPNLK